MDSANQWKSNSYFHKCFLFGHLHLQQMIFSHLHLTGPNGRNVICVRFELKQIKPVDMDGMCVCGFLSSSIFNVEIFLLNFLPFKQNRSTLYSNEHMHVQPKCYPFYCYLIIMRETKIRFDGKIVSETDHKM